MKRAAFAIFGLLALGGCMADTRAPEQPTMYLSMANGGATLDPQAAASMISLYRQNNGLGAVAVDPDLMKLAEAQSQATTDIARNIDDAFAVVGEIAGNIQALAQAAATTEELATSTMAASGELSSQSGLLTHEIRTYLDQARENLVDQAGAGAAKRAARAA